MVELFTLMLVVVCLIAIGMSTGPLAIAYLAEWLKSKRTQLHKT
jgi:uncharacterized protein YoaH (UPF0181 family)